MYRVLSVNFFITLKCLTFHADLNSYETKGYVVNMCGM